MDLGLTDATAVVVGGGRGMGLAAARCLADDGARVALVGRSQAVLDSAAAELLAHIGDEEQVRRIFDEIGDRWGGELNILVNMLETALQAGPDGPAVAFLASRRNSDMTGANVNVDGGSDFT